MEEVVSRLLRINPPRTEQNWPNRIKIHLLSMLSMTWGHYKEWYEKWWTLKYKKEKDRHIENLLQLKLFGNSLYGQAFTWYTKLQSNSIHTWEKVENAFYDYYYRIQQEVTISDLKTLKQSESESSQDFITGFMKLKMKCRIPMEERHYIQMAQTALKISFEIEVWWSSIWRFGKFGW